MSSRTSRPHSFSGPRPLQLVDSNVPNAPPSLSASSCPSPTFSGLCSAPPTVRAFNKPRRQSSISYYPSDHTPQWDLRSPVASSTLKRSSSLGKKVVSTRRRGDRRSTGSMGSLSPAVELGPLTLTEKHADLLRFIAQKESKCLELRSQLAIHEAELAQLKRKWERIVSKGMDRAYSSPASSASPVSILSAVASPTNGAVLEGIKEGMQEMGRIFAAGLGDFSSAPVLSSVSPAISGRKTKGHTTTQSSSSVSTSGTTSTRFTNASSVRLSLSSASSLAYDEPPSEMDEGDETLRPSESRDCAQETITERSTDPVISPSSTATELQAAKIHRRKSREHPPALSVSSSPVPSPVIPSTPHFATPPRSAGGSSASKRVSTGFPTASPVSSWMGTVGSSVGKKWEELQKGEKFTRSQKRASLLLSDVSSSLFAALAAPSPSSPSPAHSGLTSSVSVSSNPFAATLSPLASSPLGASPLSGPTSSVSLLEDDDEGLALGGVMIPDSRPSTQPGLKAESAQNYDDDWNW
ncbi:hypothetical protein BKA93DRAFT_190905 [Sparassis latifolia]